MTASVLQEKFVDSAGAATTLTISPNAGFTANSTLHIVATFGDTTSTVTISDGTNTYSSGLNIQRDTTNGQSQVHFYANNIAAGTPTITATFSASTSFRGLYAGEMGGTAVAANDGSAGNLQATPGTGTDAVTSTTVTNTKQPVLLNGVSLESSGSTTAPNAGTGFTSSATGWGFGGSALARAESKRYTDTTGHAATFTAIASSIHMTHGLMFDEFGAGGGTGISGVAAITLADMTMSATAAVKIQGVSSQTLAPLTLSATAAVKITGVLASTLADLVLAGTGTVKIQGALAKTLDDVILTATGTGVSTNTGTLSVNLDALVLSATGVLPIKGTLGAALADLTLVSTGTLKLQAALAAALADVTLVATAGVKITGVLDVTLGPLTLVATNGSIVTVVVSRERRTLLLRPIDARRY